MRFHGLMLVRDEEDILPQCLEHLLSWIDGVYIMDLGSTDATWEIVQQFARNDRRVVPVLSKPIIYGEGIRSYLFSLYRDRFRDGDWIMKVDADEFYHVPPPQFVRDRVRKYETAVYLAWYYFRLTTEEVDDYESGRVSIAEDRKRPIEQRRRLFKIPEYSEPRMFRYRSTMRWTEKGAFPFNAGFVARERIPIRHYPHRDPWQMQKRYRLRAAMFGLKERFPHWKIQDWRRDLIIYDRSTGLAREQTQDEGIAASPGHSAGQLLEWKPGEPLPEIRTPIHLSNPLKRFAQRIIHPLLLPVLDRCRPSLSPTYFPALIPDEISRRLHESHEACDEKQLRK